MVDRGRQASLHKHVCPIVLVQFQYITVDFIGNHHFPYRNIVEQFDISNYHKPISIIFSLFAKFYRMISLKMALKPYIETLI